MTANVLAAAVRVLSGKSSHAVCVSCLHAHDPHERYPARMIPSGGACELCPHSDEGSARGSDMFVTANPTLPECPAQALTVAIVEQRLANLGATRG